MLHNYYVAHMCYLMVWNRYSVSVFEVQAGFEGIQTFRNISPQIHVADAWCFEAPLYKLKNELTNNLHLDIAGLVPTNFSKYSSDDNNNKIIKTQEQKIVSKCEKNASSSSSQLVGSPSSSSPAVVVTQLVSQSWWS